MGRKPGAWKPVVRAVGQLARALHPHESLSLRIRHRQLAQVDPSHSLEIRAHDQVVTEASVGVAEIRVVANQHQPVAATFAIELEAVDIAIADATIGVFDAKNVYNFWRPVTAIDLTVDPSWRPLMTTPNFQEYPSAHSGTSSAAAGVLAAEFGNDTTYTVTSAGLPGVTRTFTSFSDGVAQVADARVFAGFHFRFSCDDAITLGTEIANYVMAHMMLPAEDD